MTIRIVAIGGTVNPGSTTEQALRLAAASAGAEGAEVQVFGGAYLSGLSAPTVAARFGVSVSALRKRARREGWTKQQYAAARAEIRSALGLAQ